MVRRRGFHGGEEGATAVLLAILLVGVLVPLSVAALSAYVRTGTIDEVQRSADVGALAGARVIPLGDPEFIRTYLNAISSGSSQLPSFGGPDPLAEASARARIALLEDSSLGGDFTDVDAAQCEATYTADSGVLGDLGACLQTLADPVTVVPEVTLEVGLPGFPVPLPVPSLPPLPLPTPLPTLGETYEIAIQGQEIANLLYHQLGSVLPALLKPGVQVSLQRTFEGVPLDPAGETEETRTATARRRFKNVVVVPIAEPDYLVEVPGGSGIDVDGDGDYEIRFDSGTLVELDGATIDLNPALDASWDELSSLVATVSDETDALLAEIGNPPALPGGTIPLGIDDGITIELPGITGDIDLQVSAVTPPPIDFDCQLGIKRLLDDLDDIFSPGAGDPPTQQEIVEEAAATGTMVYAFVVGDPTNPSTKLNFGNLTEILGIPFFDFVPVCISGTVAVPTTEEIGCLARATGGFRASLVPN